MPEQSYAIIKTGGKQYKVETGTNLLVDRIDSEVGSTVELEPVLLRSDKVLFTASDLKKADAVKAKIVGHEKGPKLRIFKFKPKRGYRRRTGHRQPMTRIEITTIPGGRAAAASKAKTKQEAK